AASSRSPLVACHPELGLVVRPPQPAPGASDAAADPATSRGFAWQAYLTLERADDEKESLRLFYVAATRARDALVLSAGLSADEPVKASSVAMRLLDERFDRRTGRCRVPPAEPGSMPAVQVRPMVPPEPVGERGTSTTSPRASIATIEAAIAHALPLDRVDPARTGPAPR